MSRTCATSQSVNWSGASMSASFRSLNSSGAKCLQRAPKRSIIGAALMAAISPASSASKANNTRRRPHAMCSHVGPVVPHSANAGNPQLAIEWAKARSFYRNGREKSALFFGGKRPLGIAAQRSPLRRYKCALRVAERKNNTRSPALTLTKSCTRLRYRRTFDASTAQIFGARRSHNACEFRQAAFQFQPSADSIPVCGSISLHSPALPFSL